MNLFSCFFYNGYYYFIGFWISELIRALDEYYLNKKESKKNQKQKDLFDIICLNLSDLLAVFLVLYTYISLTKHNDKLETNKTISSKKRKLIYNDISSKKNKLYLILFASVLDLIARSVFFIFSFSKNKEPEIKNQQIDWMVSFDISFRAIFSRIILKTKIYKHHYFSIIVCLIGFLFMSISDIIYVIKIDWEKLYYLLFIFPKYILFPLSDVINEIILSVNFLQPQNLMFFRGILEFILISILCLIVHFTKPINFNFFISDNDNDLILQIILRVFYIILSSFRTFCLMKVLYLYNSQHISFLVIVFPFSNFIRGLLTKKDNNLSNSFIVLYNIIQIISLIIIFFGTLVYNEIIIINDFGLNEYTKKGLLDKEKIDRAQSDFDLLEYEEEDEDNENNKNVVIEL